MSEENEGVQSTNKCRMQNAECRADRVQNAECRVQSAELRSLCRGRRPRRPAKNERIPRTNAGEHSSPLRKSLKFIVGDGLLRFGHAHVLTVHRTVIHFARAAARPPGRPAKHERIPPNKQSACHPERQSNFF